MTTPDLLRAGRESFRRREWAESYDALSAVDKNQTLEIDDLERLATASYLIGRDEESARLWSRAHQQALRHDKVERAARCAFWLAFGLLNRGEQARGSGWIARARRLLDAETNDCVEQGYLLLPEAYRHLVEGEIEEGYAAFCRAAEIGEQFGDPDLIVLALHSRGRVLIRMGKVDEGVQLLDEAMAAVEADEVSPVVAGDVYCSVIEGCHEIFDIRRAQEWTAALDQWCASQPEMILYSGQCLVRRAEIMQLHGAWSDAIEATERACERLLHGSGQPAAGAAFYRQAELFRLRGEFDKAEEAYREASRWGRKPHPGLALLRLAQHRLADASSAIRRALDEARGRSDRANLLSGCVEIMIAEGDVAEARKAADELARLAVALGSPLLYAMAARADGEVRLAEGDARAALEPLRTAWAKWNELDVPFEAACVRVAMGRACRALADHDTADIEFEAARGAFERLGAAPHVAHIDELFLRDSPREAHGLSTREMEVLRHLASGETNKEIGARLFISERTVERHVSNLLNKLGVSSRAGATAAAYKHGLLE